MKITKPSGKTLQFDLRCITGMNKEEQDEEYEMFRFDSFKMYEESTDDKDKVYTIKSKVLPRVSLHHFWHITKLSCTLNLVTMYFLICNFILNPLILIKSCVFVANFNVLCICHQF